MVETILPAKSALVLVATVNEPLAGRGLGAKCCALRALRIVEDWRGKRLRRLKVGLKAEQQRAWVRATACVVGDAAELRKRLSESYSRVLDDRDRDFDYVCLTISKHNRVEVDLFDARDGGQSMLLVLTVNDRGHIGSIGTTVAKPK